MRLAGTLSILLTAALMLLPWQICACDEDGPHLKVLWDQRDCAHEHGPAGEPEGEDEHDCGASFTFEASVSAPGADLPPHEERRPDLGVPAACGSIAPACRHEGGLRIPLPGDPHPEPKRHLATRLLL